MLYKNVASQKIAVFAYTPADGAAKSGDAAQITAYISKDFAAGAATNDTNPTELDGTNMPGWYVFDLTQAETNAEVIVLAPKSSTSGVVLDQIQVFTQDAAISSRASQTSVDDVPTVVEFEARTLVAASYATAAALDAVDNYVDTEIAAIKAKTDNLPSDPADQSAVEAAITAATSALATAANLATLAGYVDTEVAAILAAVDTEVAAIKAKTDNLPASPAAVGSAMTLTAAYDAAKTAATQTSVDDLPTNAELAAALAAADDAVLAAIADVPTVAEFEARTLPAADYTVVSDLPSVPSAASIADAVWDEAIAGHAGTGSTGAALAAAGAAGDPWATELPGAYGAGTAGALLSGIDSSVDEAAIAAAVLAAADSDPISANVTYSAGVVVSGRLAEATDVPAAAPSAASVADAVWDEAIAGHAAVGSTGAALSAAGGAGDPWSTPLPGAYGAGTAGALLSGIDSNVDLLLATDTSTSDATTAGSISRRRGNSWSIPLTIGAITGYTSLWFTIKSSYDDADTSALVQVKLNSPSALDGLLYVNGATASSAALGSITVSDATTGAIVVNVDETITDDLAPGTYYYDVQTLISGTVATPDSGVFTVTADVTRSVT